ncbi:MAG: hypothetical protein U9Q81_17640, partial [Pseudomonadota bacterium]|nr:hypothetical protein [Pseudomonadota bacterium]
SPEAARAKFERMAMFFDALEQGLSAGLSRNEMMELRPPGWTEQEEENLQSALNGDFLTYDPVTGKFSDEE